MNLGVRRRGRELALKMIYGLNDAAPAVERSLSEFWQNFRFRDDVLGEPVEEPAAPVPDEVRLFADDLVRGVAENRTRLDELIREHSTNWTLERMARVDLCLLRLGAFELLYRPEVPPSVVINEAIEVGKRYGTKETPAFINGILDKISRHHRQAAP